MNTQTMPTTQAMTERLVLPDEYLKQADALSTLSRYSTFNEKELDELYDDVIDPETLLGSISVGTLKDEDIIVAICDWLEYNFPEVYERFHEEETLVLCGEMDEEGLSWLLEDLYGTMDEIASLSIGVYFGAHPGDGADIGFWQYDDDEEMS